MLIKYWANATESGLPLIVIVRSVFPPSRSSQFEIRIMAPEIWRISAILVPPLPIMHPIRSFGTVISWDWVVACWLRLFAVRNWDPANAAKAIGYGKKRRSCISKRDLGNLFINHLFWDTLPVGFKPPVLVGIAPAKPSAASPASGFLANPDICEKG